MGECVIADIGHVAAAADVKFFGVINNGLIPVVNHNSNGLRCADV